MDEQEAVQLLDEILTSPGMTASKALERRAEFMVRRGGAMEDAFEQVLRTAPVIVLKTIYGRVVLEECPMCGSLLEHQEGGAQRVQCPWGCVTELE